MSWPILEDWQTTIARPVLVSVLTAGALFGLATIFKRPLQNLFREEVIRQYPLVCLAEPYSRPGDAAGEIAVDFFIINLLKEKFTRDDLQRKLLVFGSDSGRSHTPDLTFTVGRDVKIEDVDVLDGPSEFNRSKGEITAKVSPDHRSIDISVGWIDEHAILKATVEFSGLLEMSGPVERNMSAYVPFEFEKLLERCYQR